METRTVEQVEQWDSRPFSGGVDELRSLADAEFTGAVRVGGPDGTWLFVLNGRGVGVFGGTLSDFERDGTTFTAPEPALPLLFAMQEHDGETRAKYYTNDTPLEEVDETLSEGGFTGYIELSENVLSGNYYTVYYGGRSISCAFVGASERLLGDEEAFERANDEVGIYEVNTVSLDIVDLPEPEPEPEPDLEPEPEPSPNAGSTTVTDDVPSTPTDSVADAPNTPANATDTATDPSTSTPTDTVTDGQTSAEPTPSPPDESATQNAEPATQPDQATPDAVTDADAGDAVEQETAGVERDASAAEQEPTAEREAANAGQTPAEGASSSAPDAESEAQPDRSADATADGADADPADQTSDEDVFSEEEEWRETTSIPALDPDQSTNDAVAQSEQVTEKTESRQDERQQQQAQQRAQQRQVSRQSSRQTTATKQQSASQQQTESTQSDSTQKLKQALAERKEEIERLRTRLSESESKREQLKEERTRLQNEIERLQSQLQQTDSSGQSSVGSSSRRHLSPEQALDMTNLFIRYGSKGKPTLEDAHDSDVTKDAVNANLQLEHHTQFDTDEVTIEGDGFESFLTETAEYQFVKWVIEELLYEIRDTGHRSGLRDLFDALPKIDRVELHGSVSFEGDEETEGGSESFDVILRDRMGNPLAVANLNSSRDPATGEMMGSLVDAADDVKRSNETLSTAFFVTVSFFEPQALETATEATSGGLLSRDKKESFVKLTRKQGYHLCLVETRATEFHLNVPEL